MTDKPSREDVNISDYRITYNLSDWERIAKTSGELCAPIGAVRAVNALCDETERNREAIAELVAALAPFSGMMDDAEHLSRSPDDRPVFAINNYGFTVGDLRNARAAITKHDTKPTKKGSN